MVPIPIARPYFDSEEERLVLEVIRSGWVAQGKMVEEFEGRIASYTGAKYAVAVSSGTAALHLALIVSGVAAGDEVIVPAFSFIATANSILHCGAKPVFVDIDPRTYNIDPEKVEECVKTNRKAKVIMPVDQFGLPCDMDAITRIAGRHGLKVIEDAACGLGSRYKGKPVGARSDIACFSFHPRKILTTGEGGAITTSNASWAEKARSLRNHALNNGQYKELGYNYRLTDLQAAIGIAQIKKLEKILADRRGLAARYDAAFKGMSEIQTPHVPAYAGPGYQSYVIMLAKDCVISRDGMIEALLKSGIHARRGNSAMHLEPLYRKKRLKFKCAEEAASRTIALPIYSGMDRKEQDYVINKIKLLLRKKL